MNYTARKCDPLASQLGEVPKNVVSNGSATGNWGAIFMVTACTFTTLTDETLAAGTNTGIAYPAGSWYYGVITSVATAGTCICYAR